MWKGKHARAANTNCFDEKESDEKLEKGHEQGCTKGIQNLFVQESEREGDDKVIPGARGDERACIIMLVWAKIHDAEPNLSDRRDRSRYRRMYLLLFNASLVIFCQSITGATVCFSGDDDAAAVAAVARHCSSANRNQHIHI